MPLQCAECKHYLDKLKCKAFPNGIPTKILTNQFDHTKPYPGDHGIRFEPKGKEKKKNKGLK